MEMSTVDLFQLAFVFRPIPTLWIPEIVQLFLMLKTHINGKANCKSTDCWALPVTFSVIEDSPVHIYSFRLYNFAGCCLLPKF
jgi:hypothetical protein